MRKIFVFGKLAVIASFLHHLCAGFCPASCTSRSVPVEARASGIHALGIASERSVIETPKRYIRFVRRSERRRKSFRGLTQTGVQWRLDSKTTEPLS